jgi:tetratricopeptide (TPR) repeat protein
MHKRLWSALATTALLLTADAGSAAVGNKPPDLPLPARDTFTPQATPQGTRPSLQDSNSLTNQRVPGSGVQENQDSMSLLFDVLSRFAEALANGFSNPPTTPVEPTPTPAGQEGFFEEQSAEAVFGGLAYGNVFARTVNPTYMVGVSGVGSVAAGLHCAQVCKHASRVQHAWMVMSAAKLYHIGVRCEMSGDYDMARNCFEEAVRVCPDCNYGHMANQKLASIKVAISMIDKMLARSNLFGGVEEQTEPPAPQRQPIMEDRQSLRRIHEAHRIFQIGQRYEASGQLDKAYQCYQEAHMICPASLHGQQALARVRQMQWQKTQQKEGGAEEQQPPPFVPRRMRVSQSSEYQRLSARTLFLLGEHCRRGGDWRMANTFYVEAIQACAGSSYSLRAQERMQQLQARQNSVRWGGTEESEPRDATGTAGGTASRRWAAYWRQWSENLYFNFRDW